MIKSGLTWCILFKPLVIQAVSWRFIHTICHNSNILGCTHGFFAFHALVYWWGCQVYFKRCSSVYTTIFVRRKDKTNYLSNQIRHELSVTIHEISTSWRRKRQMTERDSLYRVEFEWLDFVLKVFCSLNSLIKSCRTDCFVRYHIMA